MNDQYDDLGMDIDDLTPPCANCTKHKTALGILRHDITFEVRVLRRLINEPGGFDEDYDKGARSARKLVVESLERILEKQRKLT